MNRIDHCGPKVALVCLLIAICSPVSAFAQPAPAPYLGYNDSGAGDIVMTRIQVSITTPYTYFETMGGNSGENGGWYCGIQDSGDAGKNYIFSLWDPVSGDGTSTAVYWDPSGVASRFGGEGTGIHYLNYNIPWSVNEWYRLVARTWDYKGQTYFGLWSFDETAALWTHHATLAFPASGVRFGTNTSSFLEDFGDSGENVRSAEYSDGWKRSISQGWVPYSTAIFTVGTGSANGQFINAYNAGVEAGGYFLQAGGTTTPSLTSGTTLILPFSESAPSLTVGRITSANAAFDPVTNQITVSWTSDLSVSPQFSYNVEVFDNSDFTGDPLVSQSDIDPDLASLVLNPPPLNDGIYYVRVQTSDIFDQAAVPQSAEVVVGPEASLPATSLSFGPENLGTTSPVQTLTLTNAGNGSMSISGITTSGNFSQTHNCGGLLSVGADCVISVTFNPKGKGTSTGTLNISDNAPGSPQTVSLNGTGVVFTSGPITPVLPPPPGTVTPGRSGNGGAPLVSLSPTMVSFPAQTVGTSSSVQTIWLSNSGKGTLALSAITLTGDFSALNTCGTGLSVGGSCAIAVDFQPTAAGTRTGTLTISDNAAASPQTVLLSGTGMEAVEVGPGHQVPRTHPINSQPVTSAPSTAPAIRYSAESLIFGGQTVGTTSSPQSIILTNPTDSPLAITSMFVSGDFSQTNDCGPILNGGNNCKISVTFKPGGTGAATGTLTISGGPGGTPQEVTLRGQGKAPTQPARAKGDY